MLIHGPAPPVVPGVIVKLKGQGPVGGVRRCPVDKPGQCVIGVDFKLICQGVIVRVRRPVQGKHRGQGLCPGVGTWVSDRWGAGGIVDPVDKKLPVAQGLAALPSVAFTRQKYWVFSPSPSTGQDVVPLPSGIKSEVCLSGELNPFAVSSSNM